MNHNLFHITNNRLAKLAGVMMIGALVLSACMTAAAPADAPAQTAAPAPAETAAPKVNSAPAEQSGASLVSEPTISVVSDPKLGKILVGDKGMTLYIFTKDEANKSNCGADCLAYWPALLTKGKPTLGAGVDASLIGTATLADGSKIVTYNKMPLYYFVQDTKAGDTTGQGFQSQWYVISPAGKTIDEDASTGEQSAPAATTAPAASVAPAATEATISVASDAKLGKILVGNNGMTLYMFTKDGPNQVNCKGDCLKAWPPLVTEGKPVLGEGVDASLISTASLPDGSMILTYNKMPLYFWKKDTKAGDVTGQGVGGVWYVVSPDGKAVDEDASSAAPAPAVNAAPAPAMTEPSISVVNNPKLGKILVGDKGMTLYVFTKDAPNQSNCTGDCLKNWPALLTQGTPTLGEGVNASLIGTATLADGTKIVTYNKMPLYYFIKDTKAGDVTGEGVGKVWFVISPLGKLIPVPAPVPTPKPPKEKGMGGGGGGGGGRNY